MKHLGVWAIVAGVVFGLLVHRFLTSRIPLAVSWVEQVQR